MKDKELRKLIGSRITVSYTHLEYNINHDSIDVYTSAGYMLRIDCWEAEKDLKEKINAMTADVDFLNAQEGYSCLLYTSRCV